MSGLDPALQLIGLWGGDRLLGPEVRGHVVVSPCPKGWAAHIAGFEVAVRFENEGVAFGLPGGKGEYRGNRDLKSGAIVGHWIQPARVLSGDRFATTLVLSETGKGVWQGDIVPLDEELSIYLVVRQDTDGTVSSFIRNPERNLWGGVQYRVLLEGTTVRLLNRATGGDGPHGTYSPEADAILLEIPGPGVTLPLARRNRNTAPRLYARTSTMDVYTYERPSQEDDGWATASLGEVGLDPGPIHALIQSVLDTDPIAARVACIHSILLARHGKLVLEEYFSGFDRERPHDLRSASKTFASILIGVAMDRGAAFDVHTPLYSLFPEYDVLNEDTRARLMTVEDLLTMRSGLAADDNDDSSPGNEDRMQSQTVEPDWYRYTLGLPFDRAPGEKYVYSSAGINLLGGVLRNTTGRSVCDFFDQHIGGPMQMRRYHINLMPTGDAYLGGGMHMRPRDALKLGQLCLSNGIWNGRRIVSQRWMERSTANHVSLDEDNSEGYMWHRHVLRACGLSYQEYEANGNGGQFIMVLPELDLTVAFTAGNYGQYGIWRKFRDELVTQFVLPAVVNP